MISISFSKYSGCGNDFVLVDNRSSFFPVHETSLIQHLCDRREGVGADGVILLENSSRADFRMRIFNADGSEAEMCGNGIRCLMLFIHQLHPTIRHCTVQTTDRLIPLEMVHNGVKAAVGDPTNLCWGLQAVIDATPISLHALNTGVPHCVIFVPNLESYDLEIMGPKLRHNVLFGPKGTNVNVALPSTNGRVYYRTYERGVEDETPACGTGAVAVALATAYQLQWPSPISVQTSSGQELIVEFMLHNKTYTNVTLTGPAIHTFDGSIAVRT